MRSLINFIRKYHVFFLFLFLEILSLTFVFRYNHYQRIKLLNSSNYVSGRIFEKYSAVGGFFSLRKVNDELAAENANLKRQILTMKMADTLGIYQKDIGLNIVKAISARVVNNSVNKNDNYLTINRGRLNGVMPDMGVISQHGIVGVVVNVSDHYATVLSVLNSRWTVNAKLLNSDHFGPLKWDGKNPYITILDEIPYHVTVNPEDEVVTSGFSAIFPEGILIGRVIKVAHDEGENFQRIWVQLSTDFKNLNYVEVVSTVGKKEKLNLESLTTTNNE